MARTIKVIQQQVIDTLVSELAAIDIVIDAATWSKTNLFRLLTYVFAVCAWALENLFDTHKTEVTEEIAAKHPHTLRWYAEMAKNFQAGYDLAPERDYYDNTGLSDDEIETSKIVTYAAVVKQRRPNGRIFLRIKVATSNNTDLAPLSTDQLKALQEYFNRIADCGVDFEITSQPADRLILHLKIYYNPLILTAEGSRVDGTESEPVINAIREYLQNLPFNGLYILASQIDALQVVEGVEIPHLVEASASYGLLSPNSIDVEYLPDAGYLRIDDADLTIEYVPHSQTK
jgi:hypothetical protein